MKSNHNEEQIDLISRREAAAMIGVCPRTIARYEKMGKLTAYKFSSRLTRYSRCDARKLRDDAMVGRSHAAKEPSE